MSAPPPTGSDPGKPPLGVDRGSRLVGLIPSVAWLRVYRKEWLRPDVMAGLTAAAVVIPKAMAYATIAGLPVQVGLYTVFVPMVIYALTSRPLSVSTTTTIAMLRRSKLGETFARERMFFSVPIAVDRYERIMDSSAKPREGLATARPQ